jgi:hypothetical protein
MQIVPGSELDEQLGDTEARANELLGLMGRLKGTQIAHLKFAAGNFLAGLLAGLLARFFNLRRRPDLVFQP